MFFACLAPTVAFGGLLAVLTGGQIGVVEAIVSTALCGVVYAMCSGQPLTILGSTGPVTIYLGMLYGVTVSLGLPFLPAFAWVGLWTSAILLLCAATDASRLIRFFTRFTDDTFAALIALIFISEALGSIAGVFGDPKVGHDTALLSLLLALGTYGLATSLSRFRRSVYLRRRVREFLADFGPALAILVMTGIAFSLHEVALETLAVPATFAPTVDRAWMVDLGAVPVWWWAGSMFPAILATILLYLDQNITVRLVNNPGNRLQKGAGYHLDLAVVGVLVGVCSLFGLPWTVAATVRSLNHVNALTNVESTMVRGVAKDRVESVVETRVSGLMVHALIGGSLLALPVLSQIPMSVLFGLFLFMGVASLSGNQLYERARLWVMDPDLYPPTHYLRAVPTAVVNRYTLIQSLCLAMLWFVKASFLGILFPLFIALLVPVRMQLNRLFKDEHLALLDAEETPEVDNHRGEIE